MGVSDTILDPILPATVPTEQMTLRDQMKQDSAMTHRSSSKFTQALPSTKGLYPHPHTQNQGT